jgi:hypothetical protein
MKCRLITKFSEFYIIETVDSLFHLYKCGDYQNRVDVDVVVANTADVNDDPVALYFEIL